MNTQILIIGAGYAGLMAAIRLAGKTRRHNVTITLINPDNHFVERPKLHEVATGTVPSRFPIADFLKGTDIRFVVGKVVNINPEKNRICLNTGNLLVYHYLVYALGSSVDTETIPGISDYAYTLDYNADRGATKLFECLEKAVAKSVVVLGSGPTGIEIAGEIADTYPKLKVKIVTSGEFGLFKNRKVQNYMRKSLERLKVDILEDTTAMQIQKNIIVTRDAQSMSYDICVWAGGFRALPLAQESGIKVNNKGQIYTDAYLRSINHPNVFAVGDAVQPLHDTGAPMRMSLFSAMVTGAHAADTIVRILTNRPLKMLAFSTYGQGIALGKKDAIGFNTFPNDQPIGPQITEKSGLWIRNFFINLNRKLLHVERRIPGFFFWFGKNRGKVNIDSKIAGSQLKDILR